MIPSIFNKTVYPTQETIEAVFPSPIKWRGGEGSANCPFHDDEHPSFSVNRETGLWICHAGCGKGDFKALVSKLGALSPQAARFDANSSPESIPVIKSRKHDFEYVYRDENNNPVFLIGKDVSVTGKHFLTYHYKNSQWLSGKGSAPLIPYNLRDILNAVEHSLPVFILEGEKDADTVRYLFQHKLAATTNMFGANKWPSDEAYNQHFHGADVIIIPDNDDVGRMHGDLVATTLASVANSIKILNLPGLNAKGDVTDWLSVGHTPEEFIQLVRESPIWLPAPTEKVLLVRSKYFDGATFVPLLLADEILSMHPCFYDGQKLYAYQDGVYRPDGDKVIRQTCIELLQNEYRSNRVKEVIHVIESKTWISSDLINVNDGLINVKNGLLDPITRELYPHSSDRLSTLQLPVSYDPLATCPHIANFFTQVLPQDAIPIVLEFIGYLFTLHTKFEKALMLTGTGSNGKSKFIKLVIALLGNTNTTSIPLQELSESRWKRADLQHVMLNSFADISSKAMESSSLFKAIVSGDEIDAERKGCDPFYFTPFAKMIFSANELPSSKELSKALFRRWIVIPFPYQFEYGKNADPDILLKLIQPDELSGLFNWALDGLSRLVGNGTFTESQSTLTAMEVFLSETDSVAGFVEEECELTPEGECVSPSLYQAYKVWCDEGGIKNQYSKNKFFKRLQELYPQLSKARHYQRPEHWLGISLR